MLRRLLTLKISTGSTLLALAVLLTLLPLLIQGYWLHLVMEILVLCLFAVSLNLVMGYGGMISFGHAGFYGIGLYITAGCLKNTGLPFLLVLLSASAGGAVCGLIVGFLSVRLRAFYFAILTLAFGQLIWAVIFKWYGVTGGEDGIIGVPIPQVLSGANHLYFFILAVCSLCIGVIYWIVNTPFGRVLSAIRENSERTESVGVNVDRHRLVAFVISSFFSGLAGGLYCLLSRSAFPDLVEWGKSGEVLLSCVLGGMYTFVGPILGSVLMIFLHSVVTSFFTERWPLILGGIFIFVSLAVPGGVLGSVQERLGGIAIGRRREQRHDH
jgi:branched-chain amino acid transport system permease protein